VRPKLRLFLLRLLRQTDRMGILRGVVFLSIGLAVPSIWAEAVDPAALLFESFAAKCASQGVNTQRALSETRALQRILEQIKNDSACQEIVPLIESIVPLSDELEKLDIGFSSDAEKKNLQDRADYLRRLLTLSVDPTEQAILAQQLASTEESLIRLPLERDNLRRMERAKAVQRITDYATQLARFTDSYGCFERNKTLPFQLAGHLLSLAGGFFGPVLDAAFTVGGQLFKTFFKYIGDSSLTRQIKKYRESSMWLGLSCALEALEQTSCAIQDQRDIIYASRSYSDQQDIPQAWRGYDLMTREFSVVSDFLASVKSSASATSEEQGDKIKAFKIREANYDGFEQVAKGQFRDADKKLVAAQDDIESKIRILKVLASSVSMDAMMTYGSQIYDGDPTQIQLWLRIGIAKPPKRFEQDSIYQLLSDLDGETSTPYSSIDAVRNLRLADIESRFNKMKADATTQLNIDRELVYSTDFQRTINLFTRSKGYNDSAENVMIHAISYLESLAREWKLHPENFLSPSAAVLQIAYAEDTLKIMQSVLAKLQDSTLSYQERIEAAREGFSLKNDEQFLFNRLSDITDLDLQMRLRQGLLKDQENFEVIARISNRKIMNVLSPGGSTTDLEADLESAESLASMNISNFFDTFSDSLVSALELLEKTSAKMQEVPNAVNQRNMAKLCTLSLNAQFIPKGIQERCRGRVYGVDERGPIEYDWKGEPLVVKFDAMAELQPKERTCVYQRHQNKRKMVELFRHIPAPFLKDYTIERPDGSKTVHKVWKYKKD
jgi:hypothetical protein